VGEQDGPARSTRKSDSELFASLREHAEDYRERLPVYQTAQPSRREVVATARRLLVDIWPQFGDCSPLVMPEGDLVAEMQLPGEGHLRVFPASGAIAASTRPAVAQSPIGADERKIDRDPLVEHTKRVAELIARQYLDDNGSVRFESLWELKGRGVTIPTEANPQSQESPVALFEALGAFRRYLGDVAVLGRASIHVAIGPAAKVTRWGIDWRRLRDKPLLHTPVVDPEVGARRVLDDLWWRRPERAFTLDDFEVLEFRLGYLSFSRRREQHMMQPTWLAVLAPRGGTSMGQVVAVPAAPRAFEPMGRPAGVQIGR
jgi:hypothetical protein